MVDNERIDIIDIGDTVLCDCCNSDYTNSTESGGLLLQSRAVCPICAPQIKRDAIKYGEEEYIKGECPDNMSFKEWVLSIRGGDNTIKIISWGQEGGDNDSK